MLCIWYIACDIYCQKFTFCCLCKVPLFLYAYFVCKVLSIGKIKISKVCDSLGTNASHEDGIILKGAYWRQNRQYDSLGYWYSNISFLTGTVIGLISQVLLRRIYMYTCRGKVRKNVLSTFIRNYPLIKKNTLCYVTRGANSCILSLYVECTGSKQEAIGEFFCRNGSQLVVAKILQQERKFRPTELL